MRVIVVALVFLLAVPGTVSGQLRVNVNDWSRIQTIAAGENVVVELRDRKEVKGKFVYSSDSTIEVAHGNSVSTLEVTEIVRVSRLLPKGVASTGLVMGTAGAVIGFLLSVHRWSKSDGSEGLRNTGRNVAIGGAAGASVGVAIGLLKKNPRELVYERPQR